MMDCVRSNKNSDSSFSDSDEQSLLCQADDDAFTDEIIVLEEATEEEEEKIMTIYDVDEEGRHKKAACVDSNALLQQTYRHAAKAKMRRPKNSLIGMVKSSKNQAKSKIQFMSEFLQIISRSVVMLVFAVLLFSYPLALIVYGFTYLWDCPGDYMVPTYIAIFGSFMLLQVLLFVLRGCTECDEEYRSFGLGTVLWSLLSMFLLGWLAFGTYRVAMFYPRVSYNEKDRHNYCPWRMMQVAIWGTGFMYVVLLILITFCIGILCKVFTEPRKYRT